MRLIPIRVAAAWVILVVLWPLATGSSATSEPALARLDVRVRDEHDRPIAARVRVRPGFAAERLRLGPWGDLHALAGDGSAELQLPPGEYRVFVSRGPEWSLQQDTVRLTPGARVLRTVTLRHQVSLPGYRATDLHVHTERSPDAHDHGGVRGVALRAEGVELAVGTDHNHVGKLDDAIESVAGAEITTWAPEVGHFNAFPLRQAPVWRGTSPARLFAELKRDPGVFVQINHPRLDRHIAYFELGAFDGERFQQPGFDLSADGIEVWNGYDLAQHDRVQRLLHEWRAIIARGQRLTATGGSDSHGAEGHHPGYPRTYVRTQAAAGLAPALKAGRAFVTNGPLLALRVEGEEPGGTAVAGVEGEVEVELEVLAADWLSVETVELWADEQRVLSLPIRPAAPLQPLRFRARARVAAGHARTLHAVARGGHGLERLLGRSGVEPLAFTNAVYLARAGRAEAQARLP